MSCIYLVEGQDTIIIDIDGVCEFEDSEVGVCSWAAELQVLALDVRNPVVVPLGLVVADGRDVEETDVVAEAHPEATICFIDFEFKFFWLLK